MACALPLRLSPTIIPRPLNPFRGQRPAWGILRDIFTMGARPIALLNALRFGDLKEAKTQQLVKGVVAGIAHYGNCVGVPTVGGEVYFDPCYAGNPLVNAMALGLMETPEIVKSAASGIGNRCCMWALQRVVMAWEGLVLPVPNSLMNQ